MYLKEVLDYKNIILECFKTDPELIEKWHIESNNNLEICVDRTFNDMKQANVKFYKLEINNEIIGYFGHEICGSTDYLTGFFIKPKYRNSEYIKQFWNNVYNIFNNKPFYCGIYRKNKKAYDFLIKNKGIIVLSTEEVIVMKFKEEL